MSTNYLKENLKYIRKKLGKSQAEIALYMGKRATAISSWENGLSEPSIDDIQKLTDLFGVSIGDIIGIEITDVYLNLDKGSKEIAGNVHLNVHPSVHLKGKKEGNQGVHEQPLTADSTVELLLQTQQSFIKSLEQLNAIQSRRVAYLEEEIRRYKAEIPKIGGAMEDQQMETG
ncbi:MAG: helix-turn-helix transcriptional regulator [Sediminibacterium sp.]|nr:helix-turn-helix transcriptional regulator [Sediminibacterium sp.]MDP3128123.1 helix-turn-helix transcriptional regulator [Sediminibacterium sp.]